jgi:hypothetical protein
VNRKKIIAGILIWPAGLYWLARHFGQSTRRSIGAAGIGLIAVIIVVATTGGGSKDKSASPPPSATSTAETQEPTTPTTTQAEPKPEAQWEIIVSQSSCQENPSAASVNCSIAIKNRGDSAGQPIVYADYKYNDLGESFDQSDNGECIKSDDIPVGELGFIYFCHPYKAVSHDVIRVAVTLNENAKEWPYVRVADPSDVNWPD